MIVFVTFVTAVLAAATVASLLPARYEAKARVLMDIVKPDPVTEKTAARSSSSRITVLRPTLSKSLAGRTIPR
nr:hypothetical protein [Polymorphobacter multimanifer]